MCVCHCGAKRHTERWHARWAQVGSATAARWYEQGYHSVEQILAEVDAAPGGDPTQTRFYQCVDVAHAMG